MAAAVAAAIMAALAVVVATVAVVARAVAAVAAEVAAAAVEEARTAVEAPALTGANLFAKTIARPDLPDGLFVFRPQLELKFSQPCFS